MINLKSPTNTIGFHADPVVIIHSPQAKGRSRRHKCVIVTIVTTFVLAAVVIGAIFIAKSVSKSKKDAFAHVDSTPKFLVSFDPAISNEQMKVILDALKRNQPNSYISETAEGEISIEGGISALDDAKLAFRISIELGVTLFYTLTDASNGATVFKHCVNSHDIRCDPDLVIISADEYDEQDCSDTKIDCPPGFKETPDCNECIEGRYGPQCEHECGDCGRGVCNDGINGDGQCICPEGFGGNCQECLPGRYGPDCLQECKCKLEWGICDDGLNGTGQCTCINNHVVGDQCDRCDVGWSGAHCTLAEGSNGLNSFNYCGDKPQYVAITFDGWPTAELLKELEDAKYKATFFIRPATATNASCQIVQDALQQGHGIQLGGFNCDSMKAMTADQINLQFDASRAWLEDCLESDQLSAVNQFRPPFGEFDNGRARYVTDLGYQIATWNIDGNADENVGTNLYKLFTQFQELPSTSSILIRIDLNHDPVPMAILTPFFQQFRPDVNKKFILTKDCYLACTGGNGVCRTTASQGPGVFDTFQTISNY